MANEGCIKRPDIRQYLTRLPPTRSEAGLAHQGASTYERFHSTLLEEHLRIKGRMTWYETVEEMQKDLDVYLETYNRHRPHRGRGMEGRTPYEVFKAGIPRKRTRKPSAKKEVKKAA